MMRILAVCGSLQAHSRNLDLLKTAIAAAPPDVRIDLFAGLRDLPHFDPDLEDAGVPESVTRWRAALAASDAVLIACPEYAFSLPGVVKNAIDWVVGSGELERKIIATIVGGEPIARGPDADREVAELVADLVATVRRRTAVV